jgi:hypothetical protein
MFIVFLQMLLSFDDRPFLTSLEQDTIKERNNLI